MVYRSFLISDFREGERKDVQPWLLPENAFETMKDCYIEDGVVKKRGGYTVYDRFPKYVSTSSTTADNVSAASKASPCQITTTSVHGLTTGDQVMLAELGGMVELNNKFYTATVVDTTKFTLGIDSTDYTTYTTGGNVYFLNSTGTPATSIMGLMEYIDSTGVRKLIVADETRLAIYDSFNEHLEPLSAFSQSTLDIGDGTTGYSGTLACIAIIAGSLAATDGTETFSDNGDATLTGDKGGSGTIVYATGVWALTFNSAPAAGTVISATYTCQDDIFSGTNNDFFSWENYEGKIWFCNGVDRIMTYDGSVVDIPTMDVANSPNDPNGTVITACKQIFTMRERLLLCQTKEGGSWYRKRVRWCQAGDTTVWQDTVAGQGDYIDASTGDWFMGANYHGENLVLFFQRSLWLLRYTGDPNLVFRLDRINSHERCDAANSIVPFDDFLVSVGVSGIIATDGNTVKHIDDKIPDFTLEIDQDYISRCFGYKYDTLKQMWMTYVAKDSSDPTNVLIYNYQDQAWSKYTIPLSCLGEHYLDTDMRLKDFRNNEQIDQFQDRRINSFRFQSKEPFLLGGSHDGTGSTGGYLYWLDNSNADNGSAISMTLETSQLNPFNKEGKDTRLGRVDFYVTTDADTDASVDFYINEQDDSYKTSTLECSGDGDKTWKTLAVGAIGNTHKVKITDSSSNEAFSLHGLRLHAEPVGRGRS